MNARSGWTTMVRWAGLCMASAFGIATLTGCVQVVTEVTGYYEDGPQQPEPPQGYLPRGTRVWVLYNEDHYARVWTADGVLAHVWDGHLATLWDWQRMQEKEKEQPQQAALFEPQPE